MRMRVIVSQFTAFILPLKPIRKWNDEWNVISEDAQVSVKRRSKVIQKRSHDSLSRDDIRR